MPARLILDSPASGSRNMAVDEALLRQAEQTGRVAMRIYGWQQPTLSLGYFQGHALRDGHPASRSCPLVRRSTGGGAILHDREITYSLTLPPAWAGHRSTSHWYQVAHGCLIAALADCGIPAAICQRTQRRRETQFLCFQRRARGDVLIDGVKVAGSAQRRTGSSLLQHGSVLLDRSPAAPELPGLNQLIPYPLTRRTLLIAWLRLLARRLRVRWEIDQLTGQELEQSHCIERERFSNEKWTLKR